MLFVNWDGALHLDAGEHKSTLEIANGAIQVTDAQETEHSIRGEAGIGRILIGSDDPIDVIQQEKLILMERPCIYPLYCSPTYTQCSVIGMNVNTSAIRFFLDRGKWLLIFIFGGVVFGWDEQPKGGDTKTVDCLNTDTQSVDLHFIID